jgi:hypothetical protein
MGECSQEMGIYNVPLAAQRRQSDLLDQHLLLLTHMRASR